MKNNVYNKVGFLYEFLRGAVTVFWGRQRRVIPIYYSDNPELKFYQHWLRIDIGRAWTVAWKPWFFLIITLMVPAKTKWRIQTNQWRHFHHLIGNLIQFIIQLIVRIYQNRNILISNIKNSSHHKGYVVPTRYAMGVHRTLTKRERV